MSRIYCFPAALLAVSLLFAPALLKADEETPAAKPATADKAADKTAEKAPPAEVTTQGTVNVAGEKIAYTAITGTLTVGSTDVQDAQLGLDGKPQPGSQLALDAPKEPKDVTPIARIFYVAYFKKDAKAEDRPITFFFNGGPGSSTVWLHMGSLGPKHVVTSGDQHLPAAPYKLVDNAYSLLDTSDLVFIDMPGTGFGRLVGKDAEKAFWGWMRTPMPLLASSPGSLPSTTAGTRPSSSLARVTELRAPPFWPTFWRTARTST